VRSRITAETTVEYSTTEAHLLVRLGGSNSINMKEYQARFGSLSSPVKDLPLKFEE
jgi:hypothetical protein